MPNWLYIKDGIIVNIALNRLDTPGPQDYNGEYDTLAQDDSTRFRVGDIFTADLQLQYNEQIWIEKGWLPDPNTITTVTNNVVVIDGITYIKQQ